jgi:short-subunit dehydrogenase
MAGAWQAGVMVERIRGRVAVITGASRGIGRALAIELDRRGAHLVLAARDEDALKALAEELGGRPLVVVTDMSKSSDVRNLATKAEEHYGRVEILVNNAGIGITGLVSDVELDSLKRVFDVNVFGAIAAIQACIPIMRRQGYGHIVNISSILGKIAVPQTAGYAASKWALQALSDGLRVEEAPNGITVTVACPGSTDTDFRKNELRAGSTLLDERPRPQLQTAERAAVLIANAIARGKREVLLTAFSKVLCAVGQNAPRILDVALSRTYHK